MIKNRHLLLTSLLLLIFGSLGYGQQEYQISHNMFNSVAINPGSVGGDEAIDVTAIMRQQWVGFKDSKGNNVAPQTFLVSIDAPLNFLHGGIGATVMQDKLGFDKTINLKLDYAYRTTFAAGDLGLGLQVNIANMSRDFSKFVTPDGSESGSGTGSGTSNDPVLNQQSGQTDMIFDFGLGAFYKVPGSYYAGISASNILQTKGTNTSNNVKRHYYLTGGYEYTLPGHPAYEIDPSVFIKTDGTVVQYDFNALVKYNNKFWGGLSFRPQDAVVILLGVNIKSLMVGYSYDLTTSKILGAGTAGSHEIMLRYSFNLEFEKHPRSYKNTRFL